jgi:hypothetical protein
VLTRLGTDAAGMKQLGAGAAAKGSTRGALLHSTHTHTHTHTMADQDVSKLGIASVLLKAGMYRVCVVDPLHTDPCC